MAVVSYSTTLSNDSQQRLKKTTQNLVGIFSFSIGMFVVQRILVSMKPTLWAGRPGFDSWQGTVGERFSSPSHPDWLRGPPNLLPNG